MSYGYTLLSEAQRTARKAHRCIWCGQAINPGDTYRDERSVYDGQMQHHRWHPECDDQFGVEVAYEGGSMEFQPHDNERPVAQPANTDSVPGSPPGSGARPDQPKLPESGGIVGSSIGLGAEGEQ